MALRFEVGFGFAEGEPQIPDEEGGVRTCVMALNLSGIIGLGLGLGSRAPATVSSSVRVR